MLFLIKLLLHLLKCGANLSYGMKTIRSSADETFYISSYQKVFRLRKSHDPLTGLESNVVKFEPNNNQYKIIVNDEPMCTAGIRNVDVVSCTTGYENDTTLWSLEETPKGFHIRTGGLCLAVGTYDDRVGMTGYKLALSPCQAQGIMLWRISSIESYVANGNFQNNDTHSGRLPGLSDYLNQPIQNTQTRIGQPNEFILREMPEKLYGLY